MTEHTPPSGEMDSDSSEPLNQDSGAVEKAPASADENQGEPSRETVGDPDQGSNPSALPGGPESAALLPDSAPAALPAFSTADSCAWLPEPPPRPSAGVTALLLAMGILMLALLVFGGLAFKMWSDCTAAQQALQAAVEVVESALPPGMAADAATSVRQIRDAVDGGRFAEATQGLHRLAGRASGATAGSREWDREAQQASGGGLGGFLAPPSRTEGEAPLPEPDTRDRPNNPRDELPPGVAEFFEANPKLAELFGQANMAGAALKERGGNVTRLRELRGLILQAARLHDRERVIELLKQFEQEFNTQARKIAGPRGEPHRSRRAGGSSPRRTPPRQLVSTFQAASRALDGARLEGRDPRRAVDLMRQADLAARSGNFTRALALAQQAAQLARSAPQLPAAPEFLRNPIVEMFLALIRAEDVDLSGTYQALREAYESANSSTVARLSTTIKEAVERLAQVGKRRARFGSRLRELAGDTPAVRDEKLRAQARERMAQAREGIASVLTQAQQMSPQEFAANRSKLVDSILAAVFPSERRPQDQAPRVAEAPAATRAAASPTPSSAPATGPDATVRAKLLSAAGPYVRVRSDPARKELADQLSDIFRRARAELAQGNWAEADRLADEGLSLLEAEEPGLIESPITNP